MTAAVFSAAVFLSAGLMFWLELLVGRLLLPLLGGVPAVWTTCLAFYQTALLAGYFFIHTASSRLSPRKNALVCAALILLSLLFLPLGLRTGAPWPGHPLTWLLCALAASVGMPIFVLAAATPLLQQWYHRARAEQKTEPYFLYSASNLGSLLAVIGYPFLIEPRIGLARQRIAWSWGYGLLAALSLVCAAAAWKGLGGPRPGAGTENPVRNSQRLRWLAFAAIPSSLMMGVTTYISSEIAPIPLFWVIPLAVYLATFVIAFAPRPLIGPGWTGRTLPIFILAPALMIMMDATEPFAVIAGFHLLFLLTAGLHFHGELARARPAPARLTEYYIWIALGGALGGLFNAALAPVLFSAPAEYPITIALAAIFGLPWPDRRLGRLAADAALAAGLAAATAAAILLCKKAGMAASALPFAPAALVCFLFTGRPLRFGLGLGLLMLPSVFYLYKPGRLIHAERSFFGIHRIMDNPTTRIRWLTNGNTVHGGQALDAGRSRLPLAYYHPSGPLPQIFGWLNRRAPRGRVAVIGLGAGSMAFYGRPGQDWTFYEIDPAVVRIAQDRRYFTFLRDAVMPYRIILGDGRLSLASAPDGAFDLLVIDAFGSDTVPTHLLTREAVALYFRKLSARRLAVFHISNRFQDLAPVLGDLAASGGWTALVTYDSITNEADRDEKFSSTWVAMTGDPADLRELSADARWEPCPRTAGGRAWSDDYADIAGILRWNRPGQDKP
jgi:hypothetical protein